jgi:hypothetical protein
MVLLFATLTPVGAAAPPPVPRVLIRELTCTSILVTYEHLYPDPESPGTAFLKAFDGTTPYEVPVTLTLSTDKGWMYAEVPALPGLFWYVDHAWVVNTMDGIRYFSGNVPYPMRCFRQYLPYVEVNKVPTGDPVEE